MLDTRKTYYFIELIEEMGYKKLPTFTCYVMLIIKRK